MDDALGTSIGSVGNEKKPQVGVERRVSKGEAPGVTKKGRKSPSPGEGKIFQKKKRTEEKR